MWRGEQVEKLRGWEVEGDSGASLSTERIRRMINYWWSLWGPYLFRWLWSSATAGIRFIYLDEWFVCIYARECGYYCNFTSAPATVVGIYRQLKNIYIHMRIIIFYSEQTDKSDWLIQFCFKQTLCSLMMSIFTGYKPSLICWMNCNILLLIFIFNTIIPYLLLIRV